MAKYVIVEFDDDSQANAFIARIDTASSAGKAFRVVGEFKKPTSYCQCGPLTEREQVQQVRRGERFGWWTHIPCRKPRHGPQAPRNLRPALPPHRNSPYLSLGADGNLTKNYPMLEGY